MLFSVENRCENTKFNTYVFMTNISSSQYPL